MSVPVNYYIGVKMGDPLNVNRVQMSTSTLGSAADVELRMQIDNGTAVTGLTRLHALKCMEILESFIESGGNNHDGLFLPKL